MIRLLQTGLGAFRDFAAASLQYKVPPQVIDSELRENQSQLIPSLRSPGLHDIPPLALAERLLYVLNSALKLAKVDYVRQSLAMENQQWVRVESVSIVEPLEAGQAKTIKLNFLISEQGEQHSVEIFLNIAHDKKFTDDRIDVGFKSVKVDNVTLDSIAETKALLEGEEMQRSLASLVRTAQEAVRRAGTNNFNEESLG